jgi:hypothetical protein
MREFHGEVLFKFHNNSKLLRLAMSERKKIQMNTTSYMLRYGMQHGDAAATFFSVFTFLLFSTEVKSDAYVVQYVLVHN